MKTPTLRLLLLLLVSGCSVKSESQSTDEVIQGTLSVKENRQDENSRSLELHYIHIKSRKKTERPPIVFVQGGPGGSSLYLTGFFENNPLRDAHDIILFDARGTGNSNANCEGLKADFETLLRDDLTPTEEYERTLQICERCKAEMAENKVDLAGYNSLENAADLEALRKHLNIDKWILFGGSYGTRSGLTYIREYAGAEAAVLMGLFPPEVNLYDGFIGGLSGSLNRLFDTCQGDDDCNDRYPELRSRFQSVLTSLQSDPLEVNFQGSPFVINAQDALLFIHQMLYAEPLIAQVPAFIEALEAREGQVITNAIQRTVQTLSIINMATYWSVNAFEEQQFNAPNAISKALQQDELLDIAPAFFYSDQEVLAQWHAHRGSEDFKEPVKSEIPILIVNGSYDPITPTSNARATLKHLPNADLVEFEHDGHALFNPCFFSLMEGYLANGYTLQDTSCASEKVAGWR